MATPRNGTYGPPLILTPVEARRAKELYRSTHPHVAKAGGFWKWCESALGTLASGGETAYSRLVPPDGGAEPPILTIKDHRIWLPNGTALNYTGLTWARNCDIFP